MSKSTPIAQLPFQGISDRGGPQQQASPGGGGGVFVNDQHRQIIAQAQHAAQNYTMPQSSSHDISHEDEATIQETLQYINSSSAPLQMPPAHMQQAQMQQTQQSQQSQMQQAQMQQAAYLQYDPQPPPAVHGGMDPSLFGYGMSAPPMVLPQQASSLVRQNVWMPARDDAWIVLMGVIAYVLLSVLPIEKIAGHYIAFDKIPYSDVLFKAAIMGVVLYIGRRMFVFV